MTHLREQVEELELLESVFSAPGEFQIDDTASYERAQAYLKQQTSDPPKNLSFQLVLPINAHQDSDEEEDCPRARVDPVVYSIAISIRLGVRWV